MQIINRRAVILPDYRRTINENPHFWLIFSTGVELLMKAVLANHGLLQISRRSPRQSPLADLDGHVNSAYEAARMTRVVSSDVHVGGELARLGINSLWDINTPTLGSLARANGVDRLVRNGVLSQREGDLVCQRLECLAFIRRNVESHVFFAHEGSEIGGDFSNVYVPLINQLLSFL